MRIAITGPSGSGKTTLAAELARTLGIRHVEIDALHHGPNWESCGVEVLAERVTAATEGDGWVTDSTYHTMLGDLSSSAPTCSSGSTCRSRSSCGACSAART